MNIKQILTFSIAEELYGIDVTQVREILSMQKITPVPGASEHMLGIINVRGSIVPVLDLRRKFNFNSIDETLETSIIVLEIRMEDEEMIIGVMVDSVQEVSTFDDEQIEEPPSIGMSVNQNYIYGLGKQDDAFVVILETNSIFEKEILCELQSAHLN